MDRFAMRLMQGLILGLFLLVSGAVLAQEEAAVYRVADVVVDVTADNAAQARDKAILQAQRQGFDLLLVRLGAEGRGANAGDEALVEMVKAFDLQKEHAAGKRYTGTFTIHFRPEKVRAFLSERGADFSETRAPPYVVIPITQKEGRDVLWEDRTLWRDAWEDVAPSAGLVPLIVPSGELDDIAQISALEALSGRTENLQAIMNRYKAGGVLVAVYNEETGGIEAHPYRESGLAFGSTLNASVNESGAGKKQLEAVKAGIKKIMTALDEAWRVAPASTNSAPPSVASAEAAPLVASAGSPAQPSFLPVRAPVPTLAAWAQIRNALAQTPGVVSAHVITMTRGLVHFELQFRGEIETLSRNLEEKGLMLGQGPEGGWEIHRRAAPEVM